MRPRGLAELADHPVGSAGPPTATRLESAETCGGGVRVCAPRVLDTQHLMCTRRRTPRRASVCGFRFVCIGAHCILPVHCTQGNTPANAVAMRRRSDPCLAGSTETDSGRCPAAVQPDALHRARRWPSSAQCARSRVCMYEHVRRLPSSAQPARQGTTRVACRPTGHSRASTSPKQSKHAHARHTIAIPMLC